MRARELDQLRAIVRRESGMVLDSVQDHAIELRLTQVAVAEKFSTVAALVAALRKEDRRLHRKVAEALTIHETQFFRDPRMFLALEQTILPRLVRARSSLVIWSAAAASGQEAYSVAMLARDRFPGLDVRILATDFSHAMVSRVAEGAYSDFEIHRGLTQELRERHFEKDGEQWRVRRKVRAMVEVADFNLAGIWPVFPRFDVILLRNVLVYLDETVRDQILAQVRSALAADGVLVVGATESCVISDDGFERFVAGQSTFYRPLSHEEHR